MNFLAISSPRKFFKPEVNKGHLAFVRRQPCCVCGSTRDVEAAHTGGRGLRQEPLRYGPSRCVSAITRPATTATMR